MKLKIKQQFKQELKKGTGKAIHLFRSHYKKVDFRKELIDASLHNPDYDPQVSGGRAEYLFEMIKLLPDHLEVENKILNRFLRSYWCSVEQLYDLAVFFARNGNNYARTVIYKKFKNEDGTDCGREAGSSQIAELDGIKGLIFVVEQRGKQLLKDKSDWESPFLLKEFQEAHPKQDVKKVLKKLAKTNKNIRAYLKKVEQTETRWKKKSKKELNYQQIKRIISSGGKTPMVWGYRATPTELNAAASDFLKEKDPKKVIQYLKIFYRRKFPFAVKYLLDWKRFKTKEAKMWAFNALSHFKNEAVRQIALNYLKKRTMVSHSMTLLEKNFKVSDIPLIEKILWEENNPYEFHGAASSIIDICSDRKVKNPKRLLEPIYAKGYCSNHRRQLIQVMVKNKILSQSIKNEALLDCNTDTRAYVKRCRA